MDGGAIPASAWRRFLATAAGAVGACALAVAAVLVLFDPWGMGPLARRADPALMDSSQRAMIPQIVRSGRFDSAVVGSSMVALMEPAALDRALGGRFANLGMIGGRPWEAETAGLMFLRETPAARALVVGIDPVWCAPTAFEGTARARLPMAFYDGPGWNDVPEYLSLQSLEIALRVLAHRLGLMPARLRGDGFEIFTMDERRYDPSLARALIWEKRAPPLAPLDPPETVDAAERAGWRFPELARLTRLADALPAGGRLFVAFMPQHVAAQPLPGSREAQRLDACKAEIAAFARRRGAVFLDFWRPSPLTRDDGNFWDALHYRAKVAARIAEVLGEAAQGRVADAPDGAWTAVRP